MRTLNNHPITTIRSKSIQLIFLDYGAMQLNIMVRSSKTRIKFVPTSKASAITLLISLPAGLTLARTLSIPIETKNTLKLTNVTSKHYGLK